MKKSIFISFCLAAVLGLTACVEQQQVNPNFDPATNTVNTSFVLNIAAAEGDPLTKQSASAVQIETAFLGMDNATLFVFDQDKDGEKILTPKEGSAFDLSTVLDKGVITNQNSRRVLELPLPLGANTMIFYGMATKGDRSDEEAGLTNYIYPDKNLKHIGSYAVARLPQGSDVATKFNQTRGYMLAVLNNMFKLGMGVSSGTRLDNTQIENEKYKNKTVHWQDYLKAIDETNPRSPLNESANPAALEIVLGKTFDALTNIPDSEARSGSGPDIASQVAGLLYLCEDAATATPLDDEEAVAIQFFTVLKSYLQSFFDDTPNWKSAADLDNGFTYWGIAPGFNKPEGVDFNAFPTSFKLPVGVAILKKSSTDSYRQLMYIDNPEGTGATGSTIYDVTYPPQLCYYANSPLYISNSNDLDDPEHKHTYPGYPNNKDSWSNLSSWTSGTCAGKWETDGSGKVKYGHITTSTRGVAMAFNVQYGQAILATTVKFKDEPVAGGYELIDNNAGIPGHTGQSDQSIIVSSSTPLVLTGIIVGGQPSVANWQYLPWASVASDLSTVLPAEQIPAFNMNKMVYDSYICPQDYSASGFKGAKIPMSGNNYTVLHDNYNFAEPDNQNDVFVALQFLNMTGKDFWGKDNMVRAGGTFYLLLNLEAPELDDWPGTISLVTDEQNMMPPYDNEGKTLKKPRVFMADTRTNLTVTLSKDALKSAVVTIPDLRAAKMSFGLSVDLVWKTGASYNIPVGTVTGN